MLTVLVSDIFGKTQHLEELANSIDAASLIFDPYQEMRIDFDNEADAYSYFTQKVGHKNYADELKQLVLRHGRLRLIGFSVGASAVWNVSGDLACKNIEKATCFYGSQIRNHLDLTPLCPIELIFPSSEAHFDVDKLLENLAKIKHVTTRKTHFEHGFMNKLSSNYNQKAYSSELSKLLK